MTERRNPNAARDIDETAAFWTVRLSSPECTPEDRCAFDAWKREDPSHAEAYLRMQNGAAFVDRHVGHPALQAMAEHVRAETAPRAFRILLQPAAAAAAALALALGLSSFGLVVMRADRDAAESAAVDVYETAIGERSTITLSDGSVVTLNTNSRAEVGFTASRRRMRLARGQAYFEVAHDIDRPFIVEAGDRRIVALGTAFDVRIQENAELEVTLVEGRVAVDEPAESAAPAIELNAGERLLAKRDAEPEIRTFDAAEIASWRSGRLVFRARPLADVIAEMNRYSVQQLSLDDDPRVFALTVSGVFNTGRASSFVAALETMHPLKAERTGQDELTLSWRE